MTHRYARRQGWAYALVTKAGNIERLCDVYGTRRAAIREAKAWHRRYPRRPRWVVKVWMRWPQPDTHPDYLNRWAVQ